VTSAQPGDGRTSVAVGLAQAVQNGTGQGDVLLVDADLRSPDLHDVLGAAPFPGLSDVLLGRSDLDSALQRTNAGRVLLLAAGEHTENACMMVASDSMKQAMEALRARAGVVVVDTPPIEGAPEVQALARIADKILMVVRADQTERKAAVNACSLLGEAEPGRVLGVVLNDAWLA
jgi:capsular exopolysaccharide synthesis family protein